MAKTYRRNARGRMTWVWYQQTWFYQLISLLVVGLGWLVGFLGFGLKRLGLDLGFDLVSWVCVGLGLGTFLVFTLVAFYRFAKGLKSSGRLAVYIGELRAIKAVEKGLLSAGLVRRTVSEAMVDVPTCVLYEVEDRTILRIEKLPSVSDIAKVAEAVTSSLRAGKFADYAVSEPHQTSDGLYYEFELTDVNRDLTFCPSSVDELVPEDPYKFRLMTNLVWDYPGQAHAVLSGLTGSFKTTTAMAILAQALGSGADVYLFDMKNELTGFKEILGSEHVASTPEAILSLLGKLVEDMNRRNERIGLEITQRGLVGLSGADLNAKPVFIFCEELGALTEAYDSKDRKLFHGYLKQIAMMGRACLYNLVCLLQVASVDSMPSGIRSNTNLKILLGKSTSEMVTQVFSGGYADQVTTNPGKFRGWFFLSGVSSQPGLFFVPNLHKNGLNSLDTFRYLHEVGRTRIFDETI